MDMKYNKNKNTAKTENNKIKLKRIKQNMRMETKVKPYMNKGLT